MNGPMARALALLPALAFLALLPGLPLGSASALAQACLSPGETREVVASGAVVPAHAAMRAAEAAVPGGQATQVDLCGAPGSYVYRIAALTSDGRFVTVVVDARTGQVVSAR